MKLHIADDFSLPLEAVTQTFAVLAKRGVGKTHTASVIAEEMLKRGQPIVVYDPTGAWWGLKSSADGKRPGFPVVVFGGEHADVPLEETAGATIAGVIVEKRLPAILDCSLLRKGARVRFMTDFCELLYHKNREALHFFVDEAHTIAPQNLKAMPEAARLLGAMEDIILQGRRRGLGATVISQRPALVNKNITTQCEVLIAMRMIGKLDRDAIQDWIDVHAEKDDAARQMVASLASLAIGEGWVWSPGWLGVMTRVPRFRKRETFDSSATPTAGHVAAAPKAIAKIDVEQLGAEIAATVERAKADDPKELRRKIAELEKQAKGAAKAPAQVDQRVIELAVQAATIARDKHWQAAIRERDGQIAQLKKRLEKIGQLAAAEEGQSKLNSCEPVKFSPPLRKVPAPQKQPLSAPIAKNGSDYARSDAGDDAPLGKAERAILFAFYWLRNEEAAPAKIAFYSDYSAGSSTTNNALGRLRHGLVSGWRITPDGAAVAERLGVSEKPAGSELADWLRSKLGRSERAMLDALIDCYPQRLTGQQLSESSGYSLGSSTFNNAIGKLRTIEAAEGYEREGGTKAADVFFE